MFFSGMLYGTSVCWHNNIRLESEQQIGQPLSSI